MRLSVIILTLSEEVSVGTLLRGLSETPGLHEVVVAAGGSGYARPLSPAPSAAIALRAGPRREVARRGAREATGEILLFLLADLEPPGDLAAQISEAV